MFKKLFIITSVLLLSISLSNAQQAFKKGDACINLGIGLGSPYDYGYNTVGLPSFNAAFEYGIVDIPKVGVITAGAFTDFRYTWYKYDKYKYTWTYTTIAARAAFHLAFLKTSKFDVYGGLMTGIRHEVGKYDDGIVDNYSDNVFTTDVFVGGKIMFSPKVGAFAEAGYGVSFLKIGFAFMF
jgi:hypothetical protein